MFRYRELGLTQAYQIGATLLLTALFWALYAVLDGRLPAVALGGPTSYVEYYVALILAFQISFLRSRHQDILSITSGLLESHRFVLPHILFATAITCVYLVLKQDVSLSRFFLFSYIPLAYVMLVLFTRYAAFDILRYFLRHHSEPLLLIGEPSQLAGVQSLLEKAKLFGFSIVGIATDAPQEALPAGIRRLGGPEDLERILDDHGIGSIFILGSPRDRRVLGGWMRLAEARGCRVTLVNDLDVFLQRKLSYFRCDDIDLIELRDEPLQNLVNRTLKRTFDILLSLPVVVLVLPPLMLLVWTLQRLQAPGPLFFRQNRSGLNNEHFTIFKFRTMYADRCDSADQATQDDERVFPAGRWLRRFSLDEFPQFFNVLLGQMSLAGPRPHMPQHDRIFAETMTSYRVRGFVRPGVTGLAQIRGLRGPAIRPEDVVRRVECDIEYIENWSLMLDLRIVWRTFLQMLHPPRSAY